MKGIEFQKINSSNEDAILAFVNKQISEIQSIFVIINALDAYFKNQVDTEFKVKVKGMQLITHLKVLNGVLTFIKQKML